MLINGYSVSENVNIAPYCSMKVGGVARYFASPENENELIEVLAGLRDMGIKYTVVGKCSNLIFADGIFEGAVIITERLKGLDISDGVITAACGETLSSLASFACDNSIAGLEYAHGIPGSVGGGVYMNAGAYGGEIKDNFISCRVLDKNLEITELSIEDMGFGYRKSVLANGEYILLSAKFKGISGEREAILARMNELMAKRRASQPLSYPSCGSAFKRPEGHYAGALIEGCGLKGKSIGGAAVSEKHAGFVINLGSATATDVIKLLEFVSDEVFSKTGVRLEPEIRIIK